MRSHKIRLRLTKEQESLCWWYSKVARNYWNLLVAIDRLNTQGEFDTLLEDRGLNTYYSDYFNRTIYSLGQSDYLNLAKWYVGKEPEQDPDKWSWYYQPNQSFIYTSLARNFVRVHFQNKGKVNFRAIDKVTPSFPVRCDAFSKDRPSRIYLKSDKKLQIPTLGLISIGKTRDGYDLSCKKQTAQVNFDGKYWYLTYSEDVDTSFTALPDFTEGVGVDLGIKTLATMSDGTIVPNIRTFRRVRILNKRLKRLQRKLSRKYLVNNCTKHNKTKNIIKLERQIRLIHRSLKNIRINHIREFVANLVRKQPMFIALEDLNVKGMLKNKHLSKAIANCSFYTIREHILRKASERHVAVRLVDRFFPSSKTCSSCGYYKKNLTLNDRTFNCNNCHDSIDRDLNAAYNLVQTNDYVLL